MPPADMLIPDATVARAINRSARTLWRWDNVTGEAPAGWPRPVYLGRSKFRSSAAFEAFVRGLPNKRETAA
jgi:hypothetical protein